MTVSTVTTASPGQPSSSIPQELRKRADRILMPIQTQPDPGTITMAAGQMVGELAKLPPDAQRTLMFHVLSDVAKGSNEHAQTIGGGEPTA